jgi:16S rRNA C1402 N4-methylase RsmH
VVVRVLVDDLLLELELLLPQAAILSTTTSTLAIVSFIRMEDPPVDVDSTSARMRAAE